MHHPCQFYIFRHRGQGANCGSCRWLDLPPWPPAFMAIWQQLATSMDMTCCYVGFGDLPRCYMMLHEQNWSNMSFITGRDLFWGVLWVSEIPMYPLYFQVHSSEAWNIKFQWQVWTVQMAHPSTPNHPKFSNGLRPALWLAMAEHVVSIEIHNAVNGEQLVLGLSISDRCQFAGSQQLATTGNSSRSQNNHYILSLNLTFLNCQELYMTILIAQELKLSKWIYTVDLNVLQPSGLHFLMPF